jgi:hypothetical protein
MTPFIKAIVLLAFVASSSFAADLKHEAWHKPVREYEQSDSVMVPVIDYALIQKIEVGMTFDEVKHIAGLAPVDYYIHPDYAILETKVGEDYYEVAFLHKKSQTVEAISYRKSPWKKEPAKSLRATRDGWSGSASWLTSFSLTCRSSRR